MSLLANSFTSFEASSSNMRILTSIVLVLVCGRYALAGPVAKELEARASSLRSLLVSCLDAQAEGAGEDTPHLTACLASRLGKAGAVKLLPGVVLSSEKLEGAGGRAMAGRAIKLSLPWTNATSRLLGGWGTPSLVLTGDTSSLDVSMELKKDDVDSEGRAKKLKKLLLPLLIGLKVKSALIGMLGYGAVAALAGKALLVSIASIIISAVIWMRKIYHTWDAGHVAQYSAYEPYYHHHRSYETAAAAAAHSLTADASNHHHQTHGSSYSPSSADNLAYKGYSNEG